jgi:predicted HicB family RNase H-like nuclease
VKRKAKPAKGEQPLKLFAMRLPASLIKRLKLRAVREEKSLQQVAQEAFELWLKREVDNEA